MHASSRVGVAGFLGVGFRKREIIMREKCCRKFEFRATRYHLITLVLDGFSVILLCLSIVIYI